ncbi:MAG: universal stress protein, partial [Bacteroidota bacterium]
MKRIIVPIDFSKEAMEGLNLAITLSKSIPSVIEMVYVQKKKDEFYHITKEKEQELAEKKFKEIQKKYKSKLPKNTELKYIIKKGKIYTEVVNQAHSFNDSFIVSSTHGASGFEKFFLGSNTFKIITATTKPVFTIRDTISPKEIRNIILPLDTTHDTRQKVPFTAEIAGFCNAKIHVVSVCQTLSKEFEKKLNGFSKQTCEYLDKQNIPYETDFRSGKNITDLTQEYAKEVNADLISIMTEQSLAFSGVVIGGNAQEMLNTSDFPVLSITPKELSIKGNFRTQGY